MTSIKISGKGHNSLGGVWVGDVLGVKFSTRNLLRVNPAGLILRVEVGGGGSIWLVLAREVNLAYARLTPELIWRGVLFVNCICIVSAMTDGCLTFAKERLLRNVLGFLRSAVKTW